MGKQGIAYRFLYCIDGVELMGSHWCPRFIKAFRRAMMSYHLISYREASSPVLACSLSRFSRNQSARLRLFGAILYHSLSSHFVVIGRGEACRSRCQNLYIRSQKASGDRLHTSNSAWEPTWAVCCCGEPVVSFGLNLGCGFSCDGFLLKTVSPVLLWMVDTGCSWRGSALRWATPPSA